jgi:methylglutaconyl-CoA hydratase
VSAAPLRVARHGATLRLTLDRPDKRNALDRATIDALSGELLRSAQDDGVRVVEITGAGDVFCAGADLAEMRAQVDATEAQNLEHAARLARLLGTLDSLPKPTVAIVNGDGYGGALGLIACCDVVIAVDTAGFAFSEIRLGLVPAMISPFVLEKMPLSAARRYFLTGERLTAAELRHHGLVHEVVAVGDMDSTCARIRRALLDAAPRAQGHAKALLRDVAHPGADRGAQSLKLAALLARLRVQPEAREGFDAFFGKRPPSWRVD